MRGIRSIFSIIVFILFSHSAISQERPASFADLTEKLMPAVGTFQQLRLLLKT